MKKKKLKKRIEELELELIEKQSCVDYWYDGAMALVANPGCKKSLEMEHVYLNGRMVDDALFFGEG